jgi:DNA-binding MarR family transcriptional regulator
MANPARSVRAVDGPADLSSILDSVRALVEALRASSRRSEKDLGVSGAQLFVLQNLGERDGCSMNELAAMTHTHQSSVSVVVSRLEERGLVARAPSPEDRRRVAIRLTPRGRKLLARAPSPAQEALFRSLSDLSPTDRQRLEKLLRQVVDGAGFDSARAPLFFEGNIR